MKKSITEQKSFQVLHDRLLKENKGKHIVWLQEVLIECCFIKLTMDSPKDETKTIPIMEPIPRHSICKSLPALIGTNDFNIFSVLQ